MTPRASVTVTTIGRPSGIAATARLKTQYITIIQQYHTLSPLNIIFVAQMQTLPDSNGKHTQNIPTLYPTKKQNTT